MESSRPLTGRLASAALSALLVLLIQPLTLSNTVQDKEKKNPFTDDDLKVEKVSGKWSMGAMPEQAQALDPSQPVIVKVLQIYSGRDKYVGHIKITESTIENRGPRATKTLQLRWSVVTLDDMGTVILEGLVPAFEAEVQPYSSQEVNIPPINFNKILKPLSKQGALEGTFVLLVGVQEAYFTDGSAWRRAQPAARVKAPYMENAFSHRSTYVPPLTMSSRPLQGVIKIKSDTSGPCEREPSLQASALLFAPLQITDPPCRENRICFPDPATGKQTCKEVAGSFCDLGDASKAFVIAVREPGRARPARTTTASPGLRSCTPCRLWMSCASTSTTKSRSA